MAPPSQRQRETPDVEAGKGGGRGTEILMTAKNARQDRGCPSRVLQRAPPPPPCLGALLCPLFAALSVMSSGRNGNDTCDDQVRPSFLRMPARASGATELVSQGPGPPTLCHGQGLPFPAYHWPLTLLLYTAALTIPRCPIADPISWACATPPPPFTTSSRCPCRRVVSSHP